MRSLTSYSATALLFIFVLVGSADAQTADVSVALVVQATPATTDTSATLPASASAFVVGDSLFLEVWARSQVFNGLSQVSADIGFDSNQLTALSITHTAAFSLFAGGSIDNAAGLVNDLSGSVSPTTPPCATQLGFTGWVRVAEVEMTVIAGGTSSVQSIATGSPIFVVASCGAFTAPTVDYLGVNVVAIDTAQIELVSLASASTSDVVTALPVSQTDFFIGDTVFVEMWAQTSAGLGLSQVSADISFDPSLSTVQNITTTSTFSLFQSGTVDNVNGLLDNVSGSVPAVSPPCSGLVGSSPSWARVAVVEVAANTVGTQTFQALASADPIFVVATCGAFVSPVSTYGSVTVTTSCLPSSSPVPDLIRGAFSEKNRFLSFSVVDIGASQAARVTFVALPAPFDIWNGSQLWVGPTSQVSELGGNVVPTAGADEFTAASLTCSGPTYADLGALGMIHVFHEGIIPGGVYQVDVIDLTCNAADGTLFSAPLLMTTAKHGDILSDQSMSPAGPPNGEVEIIDVVGVIDRFAGRPGSPSKTRTDLEGPDGCLDLVLNITDAIEVLDGFSGFPYSFVPTAGDPCNSTCLSVLPSVSSSRASGLRQATR